MVRVDTGASLRHVRDSGGAFVPEVLDEPLRGRLLGETAHGPFERLSERVGPYGVRQQAEHFVISEDELTTFPAVRRLRRALLDTLRGHAELGCWCPNEAAVQRYEPRSTGISPHRDGKRHRYLVAVFTLDGAAPFALCSDREGTVTRQWRAEPGSMVLLRGPGFDGAEDGRPLHTVGPPTSGPRTSLTLRHNSRRA